MAVIQEPRYRKCRTGVLNIAVYILFSASGMDRSTTCTVTRNETSWMLPVFFCRDLVTALINCKEDGTERRLPSVPHICLGIPRILSRQRNSRKSCNIVKLTTSIQFSGATAMHDIMYGSALTVTLGVRLWWNFKILRIWRFKSGQ